MTRWIDCCRSRAMAEKLRTGAANEQDKLLCLLFGSILVTVTNYISLSYYYPLSINFFAELALMLLVTLGGILFCFFQNGGVEGDQFIDRFICLSWSVGWKFFIISAAFSLMLTFAWVRWIDESGGPLYDAAAMALVLSLTAVYYCRLAHWFKWVR